MFFYVAANLFLPFFLPSAQKIFCDIKNTPLGVVFYSFSRLCNFYKKLLIVAYFASYKFKNFACKTQKNMLCLKQPHKKTENYCKSC